MKTSQRNLWLARGEQEEDIVVRNGSQRRVSRGLVSVPAKIRRVMSGKEGVSGSHEKYSGNLKLAVAGPWPPLDLEGRKRMCCGQSCLRGGGGPSPAHHQRPCGWGARGKVLWPPYRQACAGACQERLWPNLAGIL